MEGIDDVLGLGCVQPPSVSVGRWGPPSVSAAIVGGEEEDGVVIMGCGVVIVSGSEWIGGAMPPSVSDTCAL